MQTDSKSPDSRRLHALPTKKGLGSSALNWPILQGFDLTKLNTVTNDLGKKESLRMDNKAYVDEATTLRNVTL